MARVVRAKRNDGASSQRVESTQDYKFMRQHRPQELGCSQGPAVHIWITSLFGNVVSLTPSYSDSFSKLRTLGPVGQQCRRALAYDGAPSFR